MSKNNTMTTPSDQDVVREARAIFPLTVYHGYNEETLRLEWMRMEGIMKSYARAALTAAMECGYVKQEWRPIEEAPKDGAFMLLLDADGEIRFGQWGYSEGSGSFASEVGWVTASEGPGYNSDIEVPTHFMPLPSPPTGEE